jgi:glycine oxidase
MRSFLPRSAVRSLAAADSSWPDESIDGRRIAVIGGGVVGCAIAFELSRCGAHVVLFERDAIAAHASGHNAGNLNPLYLTPPPLIPFALESFQIHAEVRAVLAEYGFANCAAPVARLHLGGGAADRVELEDLATLFERMPGFSAAWLSGEALRRREPRLAADIEFGVLTRGNLSIDGAAFTHALADGARRLGAEIKHAAATGYVTRDDRVTGICAGGSVIPCDEAVLATGPWNEEAARFLGIDIPIVPVKGEMLSMRLPGGPPRHDLTRGSAAVYLRGSTVWIGGTMTKCGLECAPTGDARQVLLDGAARIMPQIRCGDVLNHVAALRPETASKTPITERAAGWRNVSIANGAGSKGVLLSVGIARKTRALLQGAAAAGAAQAVCA